MSNEEKVEAMKEWAKEVQYTLPQEIQLSSFERIISTAGFIQCQLNLMEGGEIGERGFNLAYLSLYRLRCWTVKHQIKN